MCKKYETMQRVFYYQSLISWIQTKQYILKPGTNMKGFIKTEAIDGWLDKGNGTTTVYMRNGMAVNIPTEDWLKGWNSNKEIAETITTDKMICIGGSNLE